MNLSKMQKTFIEVNAEKVRAGEMDPKDLAKEAGATVRAVNAYLKTLKAPEPPKPVVPPLSEKIGDFAVSQQGGAISMTQSQASRSDRFLPDGTLNPLAPTGDGKAFFEKRLAGAVFKPRPNEPSR